MEKILIIDDDVTFSLMLRTWLGKKGFGVDTAADIAAGRRLLAEGSYDLVLSDMRLPDGDGTDLLQWIAERGVTVPGRKSIFQIPYRLSVMGTLPGLRER